MQSKITKRFLLALLALVGATTLIPMSQAQKPDAAFSPQIPKVWDEEDLHSWALPLARLGRPPSYVSADYFYRMPEVTIYRTYPVYAPGKEPPDYLNWLRRQEPGVAFDPAKLKTEDDWIKAGETVFHATVETPTWATGTVEDLRDPAYLKAVGIPVAADGTLPGIRYSISRKGEVRWDFMICAGCHTRMMPDGKEIEGAQGNTPNGKRQAYNLRRLGEAPGKPLPPMFSDSSVPWLSPDPAERLKAFSFADVLAVLEDVRRPGVFPRPGSSWLYPVKAVDLIGIRDRKYLDATGLNRRRGIGDLMRYAALVSFADSAEFGPHRMLAPETRRATVRLPDEALYAMALYIYSLQPPRNPNPFDEKSKAGQKVFAREGCAACHTPPLYTNNKLTLAEGFTPPKDAPATLDIMRLSVGTDPGSALGTRKGTGYYKVPSLKGVWYRGHYLHDGSAASLEEMFDPDRLKGTHEPGGFIPPGAKAHAIKGHEFGLKLSAEERAGLIAFLRTL